MSLDELITSSLTMPGDPDIKRIARKRLPDIPDAVQSWIEDPALPGLYLSGPSGRGKTWIAAYAGAALGEVRFWSEDRFIRDLERLRWYERLVATQRYTADEQYGEYQTFERAYERLCRATCVVFDDVLLWSALEYQREEMVKIIRRRLKEGQRTIICSKSKPEPGTILYDCLSLCEEVVL